MGVIKDIIYVNKQAGKNTLKSFSKNWYIIFTGLIYTILNLIIYQLISNIFRGPLYILSGIITVIISSSFISNYLYLLFNIINYDRIRVQDFKDGFTIFIRKIYGVLFISYIANLLLSLLVGSSGRGLGNIDSLIFLLVFIIFNALPETIYLKHYNPWDSIVYSFDFMKENWFNWILVNGIFLALLYLITGNILINVFNTHISVNIFSLFSLREGVGYLIGQSIFSIMMIYRGHMYKILSTSTRRKREFMNKF